MVVQVHCGTVLGDKFPAMLKMRPPKQSHNALGQPSQPGLPRSHLHPLTHGGGGELLALPPPLTG